MTKRMGFIYVSFGALILFLATGLCHGEMSISVQLADSNTLIPWVDANVPYVYQDLMAGTEMTLIIEANQAGPWPGGLIYITPAFWEQGQLFGRDYNNETDDYEGSHTPAAGSRAQVRNNYLDFSGNEVIGFRLRGDSAPPAAGPHFIFDFNTYAPGECVIDFVDITVSFVEPAFSMVFPLVPTRNFDFDHGVSFCDFAIQAQDWRSAVDHDPNDPNIATAHDINQDGFINTSDFRLFADYWLARSRGQADPNQGIVDTLD
ncbi:hypothetical protein ACFL6U_04530 [Planctomycetota bacterium]